MRIRQSARLVVIDELSRVLLQQVQDDGIKNPLKPLTGPFWITVGGGLEEGESFEQAATRELWEETGMRDVEVGPWLWTREVALDWRGTPTVSHERYFLVRVKETAVSIENLEPIERRGYLSHRWWPIKEMGDSDEIFRPEGLGDLLMAIVNGQIPGSPLWID